MRGDIIICQLLGGWQYCFAAKQASGVACWLKTAVASRGGVLRDQSNLDLTAAAAARTPKATPGKAPVSPAAATGSAHKRPRTSGAFSARQNSGHVVAALNDHLSLDGQVLHSPAGKDQTLALASSALM